MPDDVRRRHGFHPLTVREIVPETEDARSFVLEVPEAHRDLFAYRAGQFCTFRVRVDGQEHLRCYSMSSAPGLDPYLTVTVKRVPRGTVSNWLLDNVSVGDVLEVTPPAGVFCVPEGEGVVVAFCGGSGATPVLSITKDLLATTERRLRILYANRDADSVIFRNVLDQLAVEHRGRLAVRHHLDTDGGYLKPPAIAAMVEDVAHEALCLVCGPRAFMDLVKSVLLDAGVTPDRILVEDFGEVASAVPSTAEAVGSVGAAPHAVTVVLKGERTEVSYRPGDTVLETARRGGLTPPFSCEAGNCATCMARVHEGTATMRTNNALTPEEVAEGWILTCQALPTSRRLVVEYESF
jgi:ferredoxin-NADP reductase